MNSLVDSSSKWFPLYQFLTERGVKISKLKITDISLYLELNIQARPGAKKNRLQIVEDGSLKIHLSEKPVEGEANKGIIKLLAKALGIPKGQVELIRGERSKLKTIGLYFDCTDRRSVGYYIDKLNSIF